MPKSLFFALDEKKRKRIAAAGFYEFSEHQYHEASINQIIKSADISRGSFYQYFEDKEDIYFFILDTVLENKLGDFIRGFSSEEKLDIFIFNRKMFVFFLALLKEDRYHSFFKNLFLAMNYEFEQKFREVIEKRRIGIASQDLLEARKKQISQRSFKELLDIIGIINRDLWAAKVFQNLEEKQVLEMYDRRMEVLKSSKIGMGLTKMT